MRNSTKVLLILGVIFTTLGAYLLWRSRSLSFWSTNGMWGIERLYIEALLVLAVGVISLIIAYIRFLRSRSLAGSIFFTTVTSAVIFFIGARFMMVMPMVNSSTAAVSPMTRTYNVGTTNFTMNFAYIGLFAIWLLFVAIFMFVQVRPVGKIDKALSYIEQGNTDKKFRIGRNREFKRIEDKLNYISEKTNMELRLREEMTKYNETAEALKNERISKKK